MKINQLEIPDGKKIIIGFPDSSLEEVHRAKDAFKEAKDSSIILATFYFEKILENNDIIIINAYRNLSSKTKKWWQFWK